MQNLQFEVPAGNEETAFGDAFRRDSAQLSGQLQGSHAPLERLFKRPNHFTELVRGFVDKFQPEMADARAAPGFQMAASLLRLGSKNRIAASHVGHHGMRSAGRILERDAVLYTGTAAIAIACAGREEPAEHAVLGMEHRQVLIGDNLNPVAAGFAGKIRNLSIPKILGPVRTFGKNDSAGKGVDASPSRKNVGRLARE